MWKAVVDSAIGTSHERGNLPCQDAGDYRRLFNGAVLIGAVSDGAGSAKHSEMGSKTAITTTLTYLESWCKQYEQKIANASPPPSQKEAENLFSHVLQQSLTEITKAKEQLESQSRSSLRLRDFACTLLVVVATPYWTMAMQVGDGFIVLRHHEQTDYQLVFLPTKGEYINEALFITSSDVRARWSVKVIPQPAVFLAIASDGIEGIAINWKSKEAPVSFFRPFEDTIRRNDPPAAIQQDLKDWLSSPEVNKETDDDKTLLIAAFDQKWDSTVPAQLPTARPDQEQSNPVLIESNNQYKKPTRRRGRHLSTLEQINILRLACIKLVKIAIPNSRSQLDQLGLLLLVLMLIFCWINVARTQIVLINQLKGYEEIINSSRFSLPRTRQTSQPTSVPSYGLPPNPITTPFSGDQPQLPQSPGGN
jgi:hypothetical protein